MSCMAAPVLHLSWLNVMLKARVGTVWLVGWLAPLLLPRVGRIVAREGKHYSQRKAASARADGYDSGNVREQWRHE